MEPKGSSLGSPFVDAGGSSRSTGGFARKNAQGNTHGPDDTPPWHPAESESLVAGKGFVCLVQEIGPSALPHIDPRSEQIKLTQTSVPYTFSVSKLLEHLLEKHPAIEGLFYFDDSWLGLTLLYTYRMLYISLCPL
jgi:hypothetical protein